LLLQRIAKPVKRRVEIFVLRITGDELVEFIGGLLPVLCFDQVAAFAKDLHRRGVAFRRLHEPVELSDFLTVGDACQRQQREHDFELGANSS
jgi:hypothetical protein